MVILLTIPFLYSCEKPNETFSGHWCSEQSFFTTCCPSDWYFMPKDSVLFVTHYPVDQDSIFSYRNNPYYTDACAQRFGKDTYRMMHYAIKGDKILFEYCHDFLYEFTYSYHNDSIIIFDIYGPVYDIYQKDLILVRVID